MRILIGGSPCTHWSIAQTKNRETEPSGMGWELFLNYRIARDKYKPEYFLYENNKSMAPAIREKITEELGVEPVEINSALVSAQSRKRLYWCGRRNADGTYSRVDVPQPEDRGILLRDVLEHGEAWRGKSYTLKANYGKTSAANYFDGGHYPAPGAAQPVRVDCAPGASQSKRIYSPDGKSVPLQARPNGGGADGAATGTYAIPAGMAWSGHAKAGDPSSFEMRDDQKSNALTVGHQNRLMVTSAGATPQPVCEVRGGMATIKGRTYPIRLADGDYIIRKLSVTECKRLQTVPDGYVFPVSDTQAYKMLGNGWTVDVIAHILGCFDGLTAEPVEVLSMYDGMSCGHIALDKLGAQVSAYYAMEIDKWAIQTTQHNYPDTVQLGDAFGVRDDGWWSRLKGKNDGLH